MVEPVAAAGLLDHDACLARFVEDVDQVVAEVAATRLTERGATRADDRVTEAAMEDRKKEGYF